MSLCTARQKYFSLQISEMIAARFRIVRICDAAVFNTEARRHEDTECWTGDLGSRRAAEDAEACGHFFDRIDRINRIGRIRGAAVFNTEAQRHKGTEMLCAGIFHAGRRVRREILGLVFAQANLQTSLCLCVSVLKSDRIRGCGGEVVPILLILSKKLSANSAALRETIHTTIRTGGKSNRSRLRQCQSKSGERLRDSA